MATESTVAATVSLRSMSVRDIEPVEVMDALVSLRAVVSGPLAMTGLSLVPVMVTATLVVVRAVASVPAAPLLSLMLRM